jgi:hypothetical protein
MKKILFNFFLVIPMSIMEKNREKTRERHLEKQNPCRSLLIEVKLHYLMYSLNTLNVFVVTCSVVTYNVVRV